MIKTTCTGCKYYKPHDKSCRVFLEKVDKLRKPTGDCGPDAKMFVPRRVDVIRESPDEIFQLSTLTCVLKWPDLDVDQE